jgi:hypothetical protein
MSSRLSRSRDLIDGSVDWKIQDYGIFVKSFPAVSMEYMFL